MNEYILNNIGGELSFKIINDDCFKALDFIDNNSIDMILTSPPYDNLRDYSGESEWNYELFTKIADKLVTKLKDGGVIVWVIGDACVKGSETLSSFKQALYFNQLGLNLHDTMIFEKNHFANPARNRYHQIFEYMFVFSKGKPKTFNPIKDKPVKYGKPWGKGTRRQKDGTLVQTSGNDSGDNKFGMRTNIWKYTVGSGFNTKDKEAHKHPAIFPEKLAYDHILSWTNEGDNILDPFSGSGTVGKNCYLLKRNFIGIEISKEYTELSIERIKKYII